MHLTVPQQQQGPALMNVDDRIGEKAPSLPHIRPLSLQDG